MAITLCYAAMKPNMVPPVKLGLAALCAEWFAQVGLRSERNPLGRKVRADHERAERFLRSVHPSLISAGIVSTPVEAAAAAARFRREKIDALVIVHQMWNEDQPLVALLDGGGGVPVLLWNYHPTGRLPAKMTTDDLFRFSGTVGMLQGSSVFQRRGLAPVVLSGAPGDPRLRHTLQCVVCALGIRREFRGLRVGRLAGRCEPMIGTWPDAGRLRERLGVRLVDVSAREYAAACEGVGDGRARAFCTELERGFRVRGVSGESLRLAARNTLAVDDLVERHNLGALAIQDLDVELHRLAGVRPCLCPPECARRGVPISAESEVHGVLGMLAAMRAAGKPCQFTEIFTYNPRAGTLLMGHAAPHDPGVADRGRVTIVPDYEYRHADRLEGAWQELVFARGPVTCVSFYDTGTGYRMTLFEGQSLGWPLRLEGFAHALVRPRLPVNELMARLVRLGMTQHFAVAPGRLLETLELWCGLSGVECHIL